MPRKSKPWLHKTRKLWYVTIEGRRINLGKDKAEAFKAFHKLMSGTKVSHSLTVAELLDKYLAWCEEHRAERTFDWYAEHFQRFLDYLPNQNMPADSLKPHHISDWQQGKGWSANYRRGAMSCIQRAYKWAVKSGLLNDSPMTSLEKPGMERREEYPTQAEYEEMLGHAHKDFKDVLMFAYETGARPQEIINIRPEHYKDGRIVFPVKESKGKKYARVIYLSVKAKQIVERRKGGNWVLTNRSGGQWTADAFNCAVGRIALKTGKRWCVYSVRHLFATRMLEAGMDHITVAALMGHRDASMVAKCYSHINTNQEFLQSKLDAIGQ